MTSTKRGRRVKDRYDLEIEDIKAAVARGKSEEDVIYSHWTGHAELGGLFSYCSPDRAPFASAPSRVCGCLTQIRFHRDFHSSDSKLTKAIRRSSLPGNTLNVKISHLSRFARWQRKMDAMWPGRGEMLLPEGFEKRLREAQEKEKVTRD